MSVLTRCFFFLRNPNGGVQNLADMKAAGFEGVFCNIGDYSPEQWDTVRERAKQNGMFCGPWARTANAQGQWDPLKLERIVTIADRWGSPLVVNSEKEIDGSGATLTTEIAKAVGSRDAAVSMEAVPFGSVDWAPVAHLSVLPQVFPAETGRHDTSAQLREVWWSRGVRCVYMTYGTYAGAHGRPHPSWYELNTPYSLYSADDVEGGPIGYPFWSPTSASYVGCQEEDDMEKIGKQHGITAYAQWLREQPNVPQRGPNYNPNDINTWPWPDKLERTLNILAADHDEQEP